MDMPFVEEGTGNWFLIEKGEHAELHSYYDFILEEQRNAIKVQGEVVNHFSSLEYKNPTLLLQTYDTNVSKEEKPVG